MINIITAEPSPSPTPIPTKNAFGAAATKLDRYHEELAQENPGDLATTVTLQNLLDYGANISTILNSYSIET